jgi:hypothetical protein
MDFFWVQTELMSCTTVWLFFIVIIVIALTPDLLMRIYHDIMNHRTVLKPVCSLDSHFVLPFSSIFCFSFVIACV